MRICIYCESLLVPTSGTPMRSMIKELITLRSNDHFLLVVRKGSERNNVLIQFFNSLSSCNNWELVIDPRSRRFSNILGLLRYSEYCKVNIAADLFLNPDCNTLGKRAHPLIVTITDLSSFRSLLEASYSRQWQLKLRRFMIRTGVTSANKVVAISNSTANDIIHHFPDQKHKVHVIYNGIDQQWFTQNYKIDDSKEKYWVWWGMISDRKNLDNLLKAYASVLKEESNLPNIRLICNNSVFPEKLVTLIHDLGISDFVSMERSKPLTHLIDIVTSSCGLVFPSHIEGFGMPVIESFSRGIPVLTSSTTSLQEISGNLAILVHPANINSIKDGLKKLAAFDKTVITNDMKQWASQFTSEQAARKFNDLINSIQSIDN